MFRNIVKGIGGLIAIICIASAELAAAWPVDLRITQINITPSRPTANEDTASIRIRVRNFGPDIPSKKASLNAGVWSVDESGNRVNGTNVSMLFPSYAFNIPRLAHGQEIVLYAHYKFKFGGRHRVEAWINTEGFASGEEYAGNNFKEKYFKVEQQYPDLVVCMKKYNHHKHASRRYTYPPKVKNIGNAPSQPTNLRFYVEGKGTKTYNIPALQPGEVYSGVQRKIYWVKKGTRKFQLSIDDKKAVDEGRSGERNNIINGKIFVNKYAPQHDEYYRTQCSDAPGMRNQ